MKDKKNVVNVVAPLPDCSSLLACPADRPYLFSDFFDILSMSTPAASPVPSYEYGGASVSFDHITMNQVVQSWMILTISRQFLCYQSRTCNCNDFFRIFKSYQRIASTTNLAFIQSTLMLMKHLFQSYITSISSCLSTSGRIGKLRKGKIVIEILDLALQNCLGPRYLNSTGVNWRCTGSL